MYFQFVHSEDILIAVVQIFSRTQDKHKLNGWLRISAAKIHTAIGKMY